MSAPPSPEHEVFTYLRVSEKLGELLEANPIPMYKNTLLSEALDSITSIPFVQFPVALCYTTPNKCSFTIAGDDAGTLGKPNADLILAKSTPSAFGRGEENVMDPFYRSGREIPAVDIGFGKDFFRYAKDDVNVGMFPTRRVQLKLYKLAVYETGGHFDWHVDSTHSDKHHATLLIALNTSWKGGDLVLRRNDIETHVDLRPKSGDTEDSDEPILQAVAFFTDTEHRVEPVTEGIRIVLQYDIEIVEGEDEEEEIYEGWLHKVNDGYSLRTAFEGVAQSAADKVAVEKVLEIIKESHQSGVEEVGFALQYLYRKASICAEYLKGSDAVLYNALLASGDFDVLLAPVVLHQASDWDGEMVTHNAYRFEDVGIAIDEHTPLKKKKISKEFHIPKLSAIQKISSRDYIENTGNEAMPAEYRYFGGGMFVRPKAQ